MSMGPSAQGRGGGCCSEEGKGVREVGQGLVGVLLREESNPVFRLVSLTFPRPPQTTVGVGWEA